MDDVDLVSIHEMVKLNRRAVPAAEGIATVLFLKLGARQVVC
ncbi:hypothetical protein RDV64_01645 [Acuticoccus sp. MNP-M23]|nr:hypothetical protein [Acuticoccus sp. MNP-M23]WMS43134.1 hypothetical protein RDV64_01645 [Acuticoccus sp. MNP-M23]